jgi:hypothetical protein
MICCGSGFDFGKVLVQVPARVSAPVPVQVLDPDIFITVFQKQTEVAEVHKILPLLFQKQLISQKKLASHL